MKKQAFGMLLLLATLAGCRGYVTDKTPIVVNTNMRTQPKYKAYRASEYFVDERDMRPLEEGVVARDKLKEDDAFYRGMNGNVPVDRYPEQLQINKAFLLRGQERFNIHCAPCHSRAGDGSGLVGKRMPVKPSNFHTDYLRQMPVGHFYDVITNGIRTMPAYKNVTEQDRWAIVAYLRVLQLSQGQL